MNRIEELFEQISNCTVSIYGAGYIGRRFYHALEEKGLSGTVDSFVSTTGADEYIDGLPVLCVESIRGESDRLVLLAVHESLVNEIVHTLNRLNIPNYVWVTPLIYDVMLGMPISEHKKVDIKKIWDVSKRNYSIAVRYLAAEEYYGLRDDGYQIYLRYFQLFCEKRTAVKRLEMYKLLLKSWDENGYDESKPSVIFEDYMCIDGNHRIASALFHHQKYVVCNVYKNEKSLSEIHGGEAVLSKEELRELKLDDWIINLLEDANNRIELQFKEDRGRAK